MRSELLMPGLRRTKKRDSINRGSLMVSWYMVNQAITATVRVLILAIRSILMAYYLMLGQRSQ